MSEIEVPKREKIVTPKLSDIEFSKEFKRRWDELQSWGVEQGFYISAYNEVTQQGAFPKVGHRPLKQIEQEKLTK